MEGGSHLTVCDLKAIKIRQLYCGPRRGEYKEKRERKRSGSELEVERGWGWVARELEPRMERILTRFSAVS